MIIAGTGHRPDKIKDASKVAERCIKHLEELKPEFVITGMAIGFDTILAESCVHLNIPFKAYVPCQGQENLWRPADQRKYLRLLEKAQDFILVSDGDYAPWKMHKRNERMVNDADLILAYWDGSTGGTGNCIIYATRKNKRIVNIHEKATT